MKETENIPETKVLKPKIRLDEVTLMRTILSAADCLHAFFHMLTRKLDTVITSYVFSALLLKTKTGSFLVG